MILLKLKAESEERLAGVKGSHQWNRKVTGGEKQRWRWFRWREPREKERDEVKERNKLFGFSNDFQV